MFCFTIHSSLPNIIASVSLSTATITWFLLSINHHCILIRHRPYLSPRQSPISLSTLYLFIHHIHHGSGGLPPQFVAFFFNPFLISLLPPLNFLLTAVNPVFILRIPISVTFCIYRYKLYKILSVTIIFFAFPFSCVWTHQNHAQTQFRFDSQRVTSLFVRDSVFCV